MATNQVYEVKKRKIYKLPTGKQILYIVIDFGNGDVKVSIVGHFGDERVFPHFVHHEIGSGFDLKEQQYRNNPIVEGGGVFRLPEYEGGFLVGHHADSRSGSRRLGAKKYIPEHIKPLLVAALLQVYPETHNEVHLIVTHPQSATTVQLKGLHDILKGIHNVILPNKKKLHWNIRKIEFLSEGRAAFNTMVLTQTGKRYAKMPLATLRPGTNILMFDGGSFLSALNVGRITSEGRVELIADRCRPVHTGTNIIFETLDDELRNSKALPEFSSFDRIPLDMLNEALMHNTISLNGNRMTGDQQTAIQRAVKVSVNAFLNPIGALYSSFYNEGYEFQTMAVSGGGGAGTYEHLCGLFNHPSIGMVEPDIEMMRFGAIRGAAKAKIAALGIDQVASYVWDELGNGD